MNADVRALGIPIKDKANRGKQVMTVRNEIDTELWEALQKNYESENYTGSILDAIFKLTDTIRNKTGLEGDGASLIGQAFGGDDPRIKLNKLQTDSEKDIQRGIQEIIRGIYTGIRNPRSHDAMIDDKLSADAIIVFVNYLLKLIDQSKLRFNEADFIKRIFDPYYVKTAEYSTLLVQEIPKRQRANIAIQTILRRNEGDIFALGYFFNSLFTQLESAEVSRIYKVISDELRITTDYKDIRYLVHICPAKYWDQIDSSVRIRTESILYEDFSNGRYNETTEKCGKHGALATWITEEKLLNFGDVDKWTRKAVEMMQSDDEEIVAYVETYFWNKICHINREKISGSLKYYFRYGLKNNNQKIIDQLRNIIEWEEDHPWWSVFEKELEDHPDIKYDPGKLPF